MRELVERRALWRCEYCSAPQAVCAYTFHIEHVIPRSKGGRASMANTALACFFCNNAEAVHVTGFDPLTDGEAALFHPRRQRWEEHFRWSGDFSRIEGLTPTGRATIARLRMNSPRQIKARAFWRQIGNWP